MLHLTNYRALAAHVILLAAACTLLAVRAGAQIPAEQPTCDGKPITAIDVQPQPPAMIGRSPSAWRRAAQRFVLQSSTTRENVVRAYLLPRVGQLCSERLLAEATRVLRSTPYLASAAVTVTPDSAQGVRLLVETVDEIPLVIGGGWDDGAPSAFTFGNANLRGLGTRVVGRWRDGGVLQDGLSIEFRQHALLGRPIMLSLTATRNPLGDDVSYGVTRPFLSDLQHIAWHFGGRQSTFYHPFVRETGAPLLLQLERDVWTAGAVTRVAWSGKGLLLGPVTIYERSRPAVGGIMVGPAGLEPADTIALNGRYSDYTRFRLGAAVGLRALNYMVAKGFDALIGEQDVARGIELGAIVGRGFETFGADDENAFVTFDAYAGAGSPRSFVGLRMEGEGMREPGSDAWSAVVLSGRAAWYRKPSESQTYVASLEFSGGWREHLPLQLSLGDARAGVRGYQDAAIAGGRRAILRVEQRRAIGALGRLAHWGTAVFADAGKTWSGDVPFGSTTVARGSVGVALLAAVPPRSRRLIRADVAVPVTGGAPQRWLLRVGVSDAARTFWREPGDIARVRAGTPPSSIFGWP